MYNVADYTFAPYKVVWMDLSDKVKAAAVVSDATRPVPIPEHKLLMAAVGSPDEAYYLAGVLNSDIVGLVVMNYTVDSSISTHPLRNIVIPLYRSDDPDHMAVANLSCELHLAAARGVLEEASLDERNLNLHVERLMQNAAATPELA